MSAPLEVRFWRYVEKTDTCWLWRGGIGTTGYGHTSLKHRTLLAHRIAYQLEVGPVPEGMQLDHLCRVRHCVNPRHLEPVTVRENLLRGQTLAAANARKTHCDKGHEYTPENTMPVRGGRTCRQCKNAAWRRWNERRKTRATGGAK